MPGLSNANRTKIDGCHIKSGLGAPVDGRRRQTNNVFGAKPMHDVGQECQGAAPAEGRIRARGRRSGGK